MLKPVFGYLLLFSFLVLGSAAVSRLLEDPELWKVKSAAKALSHAGNKIPEGRRQELSLIVQKHFSASALTPEMILQAATMKTHKENVNFLSHGFEVVKRVCAEGKILEFEMMWRKHFVDTMHPKFLPPLWSLDHRHKILKEKLRLVVMPSEWNSKLENVANFFKIPIFSYVCLWLRKIEFSVLRKFLLKKV